jgi:predicted nuclease of restriction endonuclease-like RecB superfamily
MSTIAVLDDNDLAWIAEAIDVVTAAEGKPWRIALERLDDTRRAELPRSPGRFSAAVGAIQRILGGRARNASIARAARSLVLGKPALTAADREARIAFAARELEVSCAAVETLLWSDVPRERPVELTRGRPSEFEVAAHANVHLLQRALSRAQSITLRVWGDAGPLIRAAASRGLLATLSRIDAPHSPIQLDLVGPLGLFHRTAVYGRALATLVPLLADCERWELEVLARSRDDFYALELASPVLLPEMPYRFVAADALMARLLKELAHLAPAMRAIPRPPPIASGSSLVCPDLLLTPLRAQMPLHVELVGFWTAEFLQKKYERYLAAGIDRVVFCVDEARGCSHDELPTEQLPIVRQTRRVGLVAAELVDRATGTAA